MTDSDSSEQSVLLKTDVLGRRRTSKKQRDEILDAFETGALSGPDFARVHGINYQTFATWRQKRRKERGEYPPSHLKEVSPESEPASTTTTKGFTLIEAVVEDEAREALTIELPGGSRTRVHNESQMALLAELLKRLQPSSSC